MPRTIYEKPTRTLLKDMLADWDLKPGQVFTTSRAIEWFKDHYPKLKPGSIRAHLVQASTNDRNRLHHSATSESDDLLFKVDLQRYLAENLGCIEAGLTLFEDEDISGLEYPAGGGRRIDILAVDKTGSFVVLELKVEKGYDRVVGQLLLRYMNWVRKELAEPGQRVRGTIICRTMSEDLRLASASIKDVELFEYQLSVTVTKVPAVELPV